MSNNIVASELLKLWEYAASIQHTHTADRAFSELFREIDEHWLAASRATDARRGWRAFKCHECDFCWAEPEFEHDANYSVPCPDCTKQGCKPIRSWPDPELKVDEHGNLINGGL